MVKPAFENLRIDIWIHRGKLGLSEPSVCLHHRTLSTGEPFLEALAELQNSDRPAQRTLTFAACGRENAVRRLKFLFVDPSDGLRVMNVRCDGDAVTIEFTPSGLAILQEAFRVWLGGGEDFGASSRHSSLKPKELGPRDRESGEVWFWGPGYYGP